MMNSKRRITLAQLRGVSSKRPKVGEVARNDHHSPQEQTDPTEKDDPTANTEYLISDDEADNDDGLGGVSNVELIITSLVQNIPSSTGISPIVTRNMIYSQAACRTEVDRDIEVLRRDHVIMTFAFRSGSTDYVMLTKDYKALLRSHLPPFVSLDRIMSGIREHWDQEYFSKREIKHVFGWTDDVIACLVDDVRVLSHDNSRYFFSVPCAGKFVSYLAAGKAEIIRMMRRKASGDILESDLLTLKLKKSKLGVKYLLEDLIGGGEVKVVKCGIGNLIRLVRR